MFIQQRNQLQLSSLHSIPSTNIFRMSHKCIHTHIYEEFTIWSHIQAYKDNTNVYGPLWTPTCICAVWTFFLLFSIFFLSYSFSKDIIIPHIINNHMTDFPHHHSIMYDFTPLYSPVICKDYFSLVYMYKSSRYYAVFHIDLGPMFPQSTSL